MGEVVTLLTSASGHSLVKSFSGTDVIQQPFSAGKLFNVTVGGDAFSRFADTRIDTFLQMLLDWLFRTLAIYPSRMDHLRQHWLV